jgi:hypothetical protein
MKSKSYFVDRIIKLRGGEGDRDELMKLQMVDILKMLNDERSKQAKPEPDDIVDMIPDEKDDSDDEEEAPEPKKLASPPESDSDDEGIVSIVKRFLFTPGHKE